MASKLAFNLGLRAVSRYQAPVIRCLSSSAIRWSDAPATASTGGRTGLQGFLYDKTGATGAGTLGVGVSAYLLSKELYVTSAETILGVVVFGVFYYLYKRLGQPATEFADAKIQEFVDVIENRKKGWMKGFEDDIAYNKSVEGVMAKRKDLITIMRDLNAMELETEYCRRQQEVSTELLNRLEFHVKEEAARRSSEHKHMIDWIESQVTETLKGKQDETFEQCLSSLKKMPATA